MIKFFLFIFIFAIVATKTYSQNFLRDSIEIFGKKLHVGEKTIGIDSLRNLRKEQLYIGDSLLQVSIYKSDTLIKMQMAKLTNKDMFVWDGICIEYSKLKIESIYYFDNNVILGPYFMFYSSGALRVVSNYLNGLLEGDYKEFYENGIIMKKGVMSNGLPDSSWVYFYESGDVKESGSFIVKPIDYNDENIDFNKMQKFIRNDYISLKIGEWLYLSKSGKILNK